MFVTWAEEVINNFFCDRISKLNLLSKMLPLHLAGIKRRLEEIGYTKRTTKQDEMLAELEKIDKLLESDSVINESRTVLGKAFETRMTGPTLDTCPSCGRAW
jgi:hypothetical protein